MTSIARYLANFTHVYPDVLEWYGRVEAGLLDGSRTVHVAHVNGEIVGLAITKLGKRAKLCHISVMPRVRSSGVGGELMGRAIGAMVHGGAETIHVTMSEVVSREHGGSSHRLGLRRSIGMWVVIDAA